MKIMLIAEPRTGSTSIFKYFSALKPYFSSFFEPFNEERETPPTYQSLFKYQNLFIKQILRQPPKEYKNIPLEEFYDMVNNDFDKLIFLSRKDIKKQSESFSSALNSNNWLEPYMYNEDKDKELNEYSTYHLKNMKGEINNLTKKYNCVIFYYEDIFYDKNKMIEFLGHIGCQYDEELYSIFLDTSKKYRSQKQIKTII